MICWQVFKYHTEVSSCEIGTVLSTKIKQENSRVTCDTRDRYFF